MSTPGGCYFHLLHLYDIHFLCHLDLCSNCFFILILPFLHLFRLHLFSIFSMRSRSIFCRKTVHHSYPQSLFKRSVALSRILPWFSPHGAWWVRPPTYEEQAAYDLHNDSVYAQMWLRPSVELLQNDFNNSHVAKELDHYRLHKSADAALIFFHAAVSPSWNMLTGVFLTCGWTFTAVRSAWMWSKFSAIKTLASLIKIIIITVALLP